MGDTVRSWKGQKYASYVTSREAAEEYVKGDPFFLNGMMSSWYTREWANMFA